LLNSQKTTNETVQDRETIVTSIGGYSDSGDSLAFFTQHGAFNIYTAGGSQNMDKVELLTKSMQNKLPILITLKMGL